MLKYLAVDSDVELAERENAVWMKKRKIGMDRVDTMTEAIGLLKSKPPNEYLYIGINSDAVDCMPLLRAMREATDTPILLATNDFTAEKEAAAMQNGASFYGRYHPTTEGNISSVLTWIEQAEQKTGRESSPRSIMVYKELLISIQQHSAFIGCKELDLTHQEFQTLCYLMENRGIVKTYEQIYNAIWKQDGEAQECAKSVNEAVQSTVKRLRIKIISEDSGTDYIENIRNVGYKMATGFE